MMRGNRSGVSRAGAEPLVGVVNAGCALKFSVYAGEARILSGQINENPMIARQAHAVAYEAG